MTEDKFCQNCKQNHNCRTIYQQLGSLKGSSVLLMVIFAFLIPLLVFIAALAVFQQILPDVIDKDPTRTAVSFIAAMITALAAALILRAICSRLKKK
jgi:hypothetical protein